MADKADHVNFASSRFRDFCQTNTVNPDRPLVPDYPIQHGSSLHIPISDIDLTRLDHTSNDNKIPAAKASNRNTETRMGSMQCCCGRPECAYLEHNNAALGGLERDLETAARLGQVRACMLRKSFVRSRALGRDEVIHDCDWDYAVVQQQGYTSTQT